MKIISKFTTKRNFSTLCLSRDSNQARGLAEYSIEFMKEETQRKINPEVFEKVKLFHTDSVICGLSALSLRTNAPNLLRDEAIN